MANSRYEYVRQFELSDNLLPGCFLIVRVDGHSFGKHTKMHDFTKPNDLRGLQLMNECAKVVMSEWSDIVLAYGNSDEYSFMLPPWSQLYNRRASKISSSVASMFASSYVFLWPKYFPDKKLLKPPAFDGRTIPHPSPQHIRDYFAWRQVDCHINNLYNTTFWNLVENGGVSNQVAEQLLSHTTSADKNEILFNRFNINYNNEPEMYKKGTVLVKPAECMVKPTTKTKKQKKRQENYRQVNPSPSNIHTDINAHRCTDNSTHKHADINTHICTDISTHTYLDSNARNHTEINSHEHTHPCESMTSVCSICSNECVCEPGEGKKIGDGSQEESNVGEQLKNANLGEIDECKETVYETIFELHVDIIKDTFWLERPALLMQT